MPAARSVEPTMSVNRTVASDRSTVIEIPWELGGFPFRGGSKVTRSHPGRTEFRVNGLPGGLGDPLPGVQRARAREEPVAEPVHVGDEGLGEVVGFEAD